MSRGRMSRGRMSGGRMSDQEIAREALKSWVPKTKLGKLVAEGKITDIHETFELGYKIKEPEIVRTLLGDVTTEVIGVTVVQKQTDAGEVTKFRVILAVGNGNGWLGVGSGKAKTMRTAINKATSDALMQIVPVELGCGSWECKCNQQHSIPFKVTGKCGSVRVDIIPGPRGLGLVAGENVKKLLSLAGLKDAWTRTYGATNTYPSVAYAIYDALRSLHLLSHIRD
ncbi:MAG: 30S ribosomal protein S5 [Nitrososphaeria archaeon]